MFLFAVETVEPFLDGYKLRLRIGNPSNIRLEGFKLLVRYGKLSPPIPDFNKVADITPLQSEALNWKNLQESWEKSLQEMEIAFAEILRPGAWNSVDIALPGTKPGEF